MNKYHIERIILDDKEYISLDELTKDEAIIGFCFYEKNCSKNLTLYLLNRKQYEGIEVLKEELLVGYKRFLMLIENEPNQSKHIVFKNPPIDQWLLTKQDWCKKIANKVKNTYNWDFDEALSEIYFTIVKCYRKGTVYMGNLAYVERAAFNNIRCNYRCQKNVLTISHPEVYNLDNVIGKDSDGKELRLLDVIPVEDPYYAEQEYLAMELEARRLLSDKFSPREIDQIIMNKGYLPVNIYRRLLRWRAKHSVRELRERL